MNDETAQRAKAIRLAQEALAILDAMRLRGPAVLIQQAIDELSEIDSTDHNDARGGPKST